MAIATHDPTDGHFLIIGDAEDQADDLAGNTSNTVGRSMIFRDRSGADVILRAPLNDSFMFGTGTTNSGTYHFVADKNGIGYPSGSGGAVTQATSKSTGVTLNTPTGVITMDDAALGAGAEVNFTVTNSSVAATDTIVLSIQSGGTPGEYLCGVTTVAAGSFQVALANLSASSAEDAVVINYAVIKGVNS